MLQGGWEDDESIDEAACREAFEEAGVKGIISVGALLDLLLTWHASFVY
jgi:8-oxo-dGTP pyrophosphatase MutT (NUDIX family)